VSQRKLTYETPEYLFDGLSVEEGTKLNQIWDLCENMPALAADSKKELVRGIVMQSINAPSGLRSVQAGPLRPARVSARIHQLRFRMVSIAAAVVVGLSVVLSPSHDHFRAPAGSEMVTISLSDGSTVDLAPGSRLVVKDGFNEGHRNVALVGDGFFDVQAGPTPFEVSTFDATTTVLGTSFGISAWPGSLEASTDVVVATGRVQVKADESVVMLAANQMATSTNPAMHLVDASAQLAWRSGGFSYQDELIGNVLDDVERRFDIRVNAPSSIRLRPITIHRNEVGDAGEFLGDIAATISVRYRKTANGFEMYLN